MKAAVLVRVVRDQMARRPGMLCAALLLTCALILALTLTCSRAKSVVALARPPVRFLSPSVPVVDLFLGQQDQAETLMEGSDITVLFYYAPWCAHSITAREHIHQVALHLASQVQFVAVNCWWHQGKCRKQQNFYQYPVLHVYYRRFGPVPYKGPFIAEYLESFIHRVSAPLTYLSSRSALHTFLSHHEQGVVGFFDFNASPQPPGYLTFFLSALHALRKDPQGAVRFSIVTNRDVAAGMWVTEDQSVYLHRRFNTSLVFPRTERNFTPEIICNWIYENKESIITWIQPIGEKSHALEAELRKGPALLVFLPQNPLSHTPALSEVADIALRYYSCLTGSVSSSAWSPSGSALIRQRCCKSLHMSANTNTKVCEVCVRSAWDLEAALDSFLSRAISSASFSCSNTQRSYSMLRHYTACCRTLTHRLRPLVEGGGVTGLHCRTNKTLRFYALDSRLAWPLAQRLGATGNHSTHLHTHTFTTIVSLREETHYVLQGVGREALERFILNFSATYSPLHRHLVGVSEAPPPQSLIQEVTTESFRAIVMDAERDVLLFYYTGWCGFCTVLNHVLLRLARLFQGNSSFMVARVNVGLNDLPWEFMVDHLPTFLFFPRHRKHMSVKFPETTRVTLPNLVRFILNHSSPTPQGKVGPKVLLEAELRTLQGEVLSLQRARERLSQQLAALWRENRRLALHTKELQSYNAELQEQSSRLETLYQEKGRQLTEAVKRLQELADASEDLLSENSLLKVLLAVLREKDSVGRTEGWSWAEDRGEETHGPGEGETEDGMQDVS